MCTHNIRGVGADRKVWGGLLGVDLKVGRASFEVNRKVGKTFEVD